MLSPVRAITAGTITFAIGGAFLIAQPIDQQAGVSEAAGNADMIAPVPVTGSGPSLIAGCTAVDLEDSAELYRSIFTCDVSWSMSDPRLEGDVTRISESVDLSYEGLAEVKVDDDSWPRVSVSGYSIQNEGGTWRERPRPAIWTRGSDKASWPFEAMTTMVFDGDGDYEGLVAVLQRDVAGLGEHDFSGLIMDASLMPPPPKYIVTD